eukprot:gb/GECG01015600.1/.p1 GENE.gb/GECG01015600.1/~~gb/GECG01015600.1/.p1  ORF type:complete len:126 (+),score=9.52 gb/GECG01015600.1/:1-378(+)
MEPSGKAKDPRSRYPRSNCPTLALSLPISSDAEEMSQGTLTVLRKRSAKVSLQTLAEYANREGGGPIGASTVALTRAQSSEVATLGSSAMQLSTKLFERKIQRWSTVVHNSRSFSATFGRSSRNS